MTDLPPGWAWATLEDLLAVEKRPITDGPFGSKLATRHYTASGARVIRLQNIGDGVFRDDKAYISNDYFEELRDHEVRAGDLLLASLGEELPRVCIAPDLGAPAIVKADCIRARIHSQVDIRWVLYALMAPPTRDWATSRIKGVGRPRLGMAGIRQLPLPIPPLAEQRRIVATLESHLSHLHASVTQIEAASRRVKNLRARILHDYVTVADEGWIRDTLGNLVKSVKNGMYVSRPGAIPDGVPILRIGSVRALHLDGSDVRYSGKSAEEVGREGYLLEAGDLLFTRYNGNPSYVGACALVPEGTGPLTYPDKLIRVRVDKNRVVPEYLALACSAGESRTAIRQSVKTTAGQAGISGRELKNVPVRLPPLDTQEHIVQLFANNNESLKKLELQLASASLKAFALQRSLLANAFAGLLVEQDPTEEPASILLERIRDERMTQRPMRRMRRGKGKTAPQEETLV